MVGVDVGECGGSCSLVGRGHVIKKEDRRKIGEAGPNIALILIKLKPYKTFTQTIFPSL